MDPCSSSSILSPGINYERKMNPRKRSQKMYISNSAVICNGTPEQGKIIKIEMDPHDDDDHDRIISIVENNKDANKIEEDQQPEASLQFKPPTASGTINKKSYECNWPDCNAKLSTAQSLTRHKRIHTGEKPYVCDWADCKQRFKLQHHLIVHERIHTGTKPYICDWEGCGQQFSHLNSVKDHKRIHAGEKPYICDWPDCNQRFTQSAHLIGHKRIHTGEKPYICDLPDCGKRFTNKSHLNRHKKSHIKTKGTLRAEQCEQDNILLKVQLDPRVELDAK